MKQLTRALAVLSVMSGSLFGTQALAEQSKVGLCCDPDKAYTFTTPVSSTTLPRAMEGEWPLTKTLVGCGGPWTELPTDPMISWIPDGARNGKRDDHGGKIRAEQSYGKTCIPRADWVAEYRDVVWNVVSESSWKSG